MWRSRLWCLHGRSRNCGAIIWKARPSFPRSRQTRPLTGLIKPGPTRLGGPRPPRPSRQPSRALPNPAPGRRSLVYQRAQLSSAASPDLGLAGARRRSASPGMICRLPLSPPPFQYLPLACVISSRSPRRQPGFPTYQAVAPVVYFSRSPRRSLSQLPQFPSPPAAFASISLSLAPAPTRYRHRRHVHRRRLRGTQVGAQDPPPPLGHSRPRRPRLAQDVPHLREPPRFPLRDPPPGEWRIALGQSWRWLISFPPLLCSRSRRTRTMAT